MTHPTQEDDVKAIRVVLGMALHGWRLEAAQIDEADPGIALVGGMIDGEFYPVVTVDTGNYDQDAAALPLAQFYAAANPERIARLLARLEQAERSATFGALRAVTAEKNRMGKALELACGYLTEEQVELIKAAMPDDAHIAAIASEKTS